MISIIGYGYVGQATHKLLGNKVDLIIDINSTEDAWQAAKDSDVIFICVPTPSNTDGSCDTSIVKKVLLKLGKNPLYVIRSTIPWDFEMPGYRLVANPEFITQNEYLNCKHVQLLGGIYLETSKIEALYGQECITVPWTTAWQVKYTSNLYGAFKVSFWEMIHDITGNERYIYDTWRALNTNQSDMAQVGMDGFRGFGGACFPKDVQAMLAMTNHPMIGSVVEYNNRLKNEKEK